MNRNATLAAAILAALMISACGSDQDDTSSEPSTTERMSEAMDSAMDDAEQAVDEAATAAGEAASDMAQSAGEAADEVSQAAQDAMDDATQTAQEAADEVSQAAREAMDSASAAAGDAADQAAAAAAGAAAAVGMASAADDDDPCTLAIEVGDNIAYSTDTMSAPSSCSEVSVTITHTGSLPAIAMGHNWVLLPEDALQSVATAGVAAGAEANYVPEDGRIVAATKIVGGGESDTVTFSLDGLQAGVTYKYVCTFPGHWAVMQGTFTVSG